MLGVGWAHSQYCKTFSGTLSLGLEVMLHQQESCQQSSPEFDESGTEAFSIRYPGPLASRQAGEMAAQNSLGTVFHRVPEPHHWCPQARSRPQSSQSESESSQIVSVSLRPHGLYSPWHSPGQNAGLGSLSLLQGFFPTQSSEPFPSPCLHDL